MYHGPMTKTRQIVEGDHFMLEHLEAIQDRLAGGELAGVAVASVDLNGRSEYWYIDPLLGDGLLEDPISALLVLYRTNIESFKQGLDVPVFNKSKCEH